MPAPSLSASLQPAKDFFKHLTTIQPKEATVTVGLDIGSFAVKVVALGPKGRAGQRPILHQQAVVIPPAQSADPSETVKSAVSGMFPPPRQVSLSVSGQWVIMRIIEMPPLKGGEMKQALPFEAQRYLPFNAEDVVIDGAVLGPADGNKQWVLIIACKKELIERRLDWIKRAGLEPAIIDVDALAVANSYLASLGGRKAEGTQALLHAGAQLTSLVIFKGDVPYLVRDIPWGGEKFMRYTADHLGLSAEQTQHELAQATPRPEAVTAMKLATESLITELQLSFDYFENRFGHPPEEVLVSGGLSLSAGFLDALRGHLTTQKTSAWSPMPGLSGQFAVAHGLALRAY